MPRSNLDAAVARWRRALGASRVSVVARELDGASHTTYGSTREVSAILRPRSAEEVQACVRIANDLRVPLYPVSRGKNWGYGSRAPAANDCALLDLSGMRKIRGPHAGMSAVTVEPGVTTHELAEHLARTAPELLASLPLATSTAASVVGNALDGGIGMGPLADRFASVLSLEVVLATGERIRTGMDRHGENEPLAASEARVGPGLRDLFFQSNLGIVTEMTIGLFPLPRWLGYFEVRLHDPEEVGRFVERLLPLVHQRVVQAPVMIVSDHSLLKTMLGKYPFDLTNGRTPLPEDLLARLREACDVAPYSAAYRIHAPNRALARAYSRTLLETFRGFDARVLDTTKLRHDVYRPSGYGLASIYWRKREPLPAKIDPERDRCGYVWCEIVIPAQGPVIARALARLRLLLKSYGFEPHVNLNMVLPRATHVRVLLAYDRDVPGADAAAEACDRAITLYLRSIGGIPARRRIGSMESLAPLAPANEAVARRIKRALDPRGILAPGRYEPSRGRRDAESPLDPVAARVEAIHHAWIEGPASALPRRAEGRPLRPLIVTKEEHDAFCAAAARVVRALEGFANAAPRSRVWRLAGAIDAKGRARVFGVEAGLGAVPAATLYEEKGRYSITRGRLEALAKSGAGSRSRGKIDRRAFAELTASARGGNGDVVWTRPLVAGATTLHGKTIDLLPFVSANAARFVLRSAVRGAGPTDIGELLVASDWAKVVRTRAKGSVPYVVQERVVFPHETFPRMRGAELDFEGFFVRLDAIVVGRNVVGCVATVAEDLRMDEANALPVMVLTGRRSPVIGSP